MQLASFLIGYLAKLNKTDIPACKNTEECFAAYRALLANTDLALLNNSFFITEEKYLKSLISQMNITDLKSISNKLLLSENSAVLYSAQLLINPVNTVEGDIYIYGGNRLKRACEDLIKAEVTDGGALCFNKILNIPVRKNITRLTSDIINEVKNVYSLACDYIISEDVSSAVFLPVHSKNPIIDKQLLKIAEDTINSYSELENVKKIICKGDVLND